jgi:hypothetical protein
VEVAAVVPAVAGTVTGEAAANHRARWLTP